jgi:hypothetical protein
MRMSICRVAGYATRHRKRDTYLTNWRRSCGVVTFSLSFTLREKERDMRQRFELSSSWHQISNHAINNKQHRQHRLIQDSIFHHEWNNERRLIRLWHVATFTYFSRIRRVVVVARSFGSAKDTSLVKLICLESHGERSSSSKSKE